MRRRKYFPAMKLLSILLGITANASGDIIDMRIGTSDLSSMIARVKVGQPSQSVPMSLSFDSKASYIFPLDNCQQFVPCFDSKNSATYHWVGVSRSADFEQKISGPVVADEIAFNDEAPIEEQFVSASQLPYNQLVARDTAGELSLGPKSALFTNAALEVKVDNPTNAFASKHSSLVPNWSLRWFVEEVPEVPAGCVSETFRVSRGRATWQAPGRVLVGKSLVFNHTQIVFAPNVNDIVIPSRYSQSVMDELLSDHLRYLTGPDGRLYAECARGTANTASMRPIKIKPISAHSSYITILPDHLGFYGKQNFDSIQTREGKRYCPTRIVFKSGEFPIKLGLPFFASVESVIFDEPSRQVTVSFVRNRMQRTSAFLIPSVPVASLVVPPYVVEYDSVATIQQNPQGGFSIEFAAGWESVTPPTYTLVLTSASPRTTDVGGVMTVEFVFVKKFRSVSGSTAHVMSAPTAQTQFPGLYHMKVRRGVFSGSNQEDSIVRFGFEKATDPESQSFNVHMIDSPNNLIIRLTKVETIVELHSYNISAPVVFNQSEWQTTMEAECSICREPFEDGDEVQKLEPICNHCYHVRCIKVWLESKRECCLCRQVIPFRNDVDTVVAVATVEPETSDDESDD